MVPNHQTQNFKNSLGQIKDEISVNFEKMTKGVNSTLKGISYPILTGDVLGLYHQ